MEPELEEARSRAGLWHQVSPESEPGAESQATLALDFGPLPDESLVDLHQKLRELTPSR